MGQVRDKMLCDLKLKRYSLSTINKYLRVGYKLAEYFRLSPMQLELPQIQQFLLHLIDDKKLGPAGHKMYVAGLKFLYGVTLERPEIASRRVGKTTAVSAPRSGKRPAGLFQGRRRQRTFYIRLSPTCRENNKCFFCDGSTDRPMAGGSLARLERLAVLGGELSWTSSMGVDRPLLDAG